MHHENGGIGVFRQTRCDVVVIIVQLFVFDGNIRVIFLKRDSGGIQRFKVFVVSQNQDGLFRFRVESRRETGAFGRSLCAVRSFGFCLPASA